MRGQNIKKKGFFASSETRNTLPKWLAYKWHVTWLAFESMPCLIAQIRERPFITGGEAGKLRGRATIFLVAFFLGGGGEGDDFFWAYV